MGTLYHSIPYHTMHAYQLMNDLQIALLSFWQVFCPCERPNQTDRYRHSTIMVDYDASTAATSPGGSYGHRRRSSAAVMTSSATNRRRPSNSSAASGTQRHPDLLLKTKSNYLTVSTTLLAIPISISKQYKCDKSAFG